MTAKSKVTTWKDADGSQHMHLVVTEHNAVAMDQRAVAALRRGGSLIHEAFQIEAEARTAHEAAHGEPGPAS